MELEIAPTITYVAVGAVLSAVLYVWLLRTGTKRLFKPQRRKFDVAKAYISIMSGALVFGTGCGLLVALTYALVFKSANILLPMYITYGVAMLISVAHVQLHDPKFKKN
jgi:hypothetical protein